MENKTLEQLQNEVLELTNKMESIKNSLYVLQEKTQTPQIDFEKFMELMDTYFEQKENMYEMGRQLSRDLDLDDYCDVTLSLNFGTELEIEKEWRDTEDIVENVLDQTKEDLKNWMREEYKNIFREEDNTNEFGDILVGSCATCGKDTEQTDINGNCKNCK